MKKRLHFFQLGILRAKDKTICFKNKNIKKIFSIENVSEIYCHKPITLTSGAISCFSKKSILVHFFNYYGFYRGTYFPNKEKDGNLIIKQVENYLDREKRIFLAKKFVEGGTKNMLRVLEKYEIEEEKINLLKLLLKENKIEKIEQLRSLEGRIRKIYYSCFDDILDGEFKFEQRTTRPPKNKTNALISYGNSLIYSTILGEIYKTRLEASISYLHEPSFRRFSLCLDLSEIFKPIIVDRLVFYLVNKNIIQKDDFFNKGDGVFLNEFGRKKFVEYYEKKLERTLICRTTKKRVSYRGLIRLEANKLVKHFLGKKVYRPFNIWW